MSLCEHGHDSTKGFVELHGFRPDIGLDGWPLDPNHPGVSGAVKPAETQVAHPTGQTSVPGAVKPSLFAVRRVQMNQRDQVNGPGRNPG